MPGYNPYLEPTADNYLRESIDQPARDGFAITPHDTNLLPGEVRSIYVGGAGDVKLLTPAGTTLTFIGLTAGSILPVHATKVFLSNTRATNLIGLY